MRRSGGPRTGVRAGATVAWWIAAAAVLSGCGALRGAVSERFLTPRPEWVAEPSDLGFEFDEFEIATGSDASVHGWFVRSADGDGRAVVLCHGNSANISFYHPYYAFLRAGGWNVVLFDYRGYGRSRGSPDVGALFTDADAVLDRVIARPDVDPRKVVLFGASLGSVVALRTAARRPGIAAVVVEDVPSPRAALARAAGAVGGWAVRTLALPGGIEPAENAARVARPVLFLCGERDPSLRAHLEAFEAACGPAAAWVLPRTGHAPEPLLVHDGEYQDQVLRFLDAAVSGAAPRIEATAGARRGGRLEVRLVRRDLAVCGPVPVEVCVVDATGSASFSRRWLRSDEETWDVPCPGEPASVTAWPYLRVRGDPDDGTWEPAPGPLARAAEIRGVLEAAAAVVRHSPDPLRHARAFVATLARCDAAGPFPDALDAELVPALVSVGRVLAASEDAADRESARLLLARAVASEPARPALHVWPSSRYVAGFAHAADVEAARNLLVRLGR